MRLIAADALAAELYKHHVHDDEELELLIYLADAEKVIADVPTVDAIPVEWMEAKEREMLEREDKFNYRRADSIRLVMLMWQKEQEAQNG